jgi:hypothetical protein
VSLDHKGPFSQEEFDAWFDEHCDDDLEVIDYVPDVDFKVVDGPYVYPGFPI